MRVEDIIKAVQRDNTYVTHLYKTRNYVMINYIINNKIIDEGNIGIMLELMYNEITQNTITIKMVDLYCKYIMLFEPARESMKRINILFHHSLLNPICEPKIMSHLYFKYVKKLMPEYLACVIYHELDDIFMDFGITQHDLKYANEYAKIFQNLFVFKKTNIDYSGICQDNRIYSMKIDFKMLRLPPKWNHDFILYTIHHGYNIIHDNKCFEMYMLYKKKILDMILKE
jgi:hypothetical protein